METKAWVDPGSEDSEFEEDLGYRLPELDLNDFPDPTIFLPLASFGIKSKEEFIEWWKLRTGKTIIQFRSFTFL
jgi:hypothetical protein